MKKVAWVARYTSFTIDDIDKMTFQEFEYFCEALNEIINKESGK